MRAARPLLQGSLLTLALGLLLLAAGFWDPRLDWFGAHGAILLYGTVLQGLAFLHVLSVGRFGGAPVHPARGQTLANLYTSGSILVAFSYVAPSTALSASTGLLGMLFVLLGAALQAQGVLQALPRQSVVDIERDPLTKGDDACFKHLRLAHIFLPLGLAMVLGPVAFAATGSPVPRGLLLAGVHVLLIGHGLLSLYGLGHLWVPRFSGVPAIAAGAIKGELHTTLLGLVGLVIGFLIGLDHRVGRGFVAGFGPVVFLGFFVYMGVLGANIMRNKSRTQRVTPEFNYIPWTFAGVFWLISAVLLGVFINAIPDILSQYTGSLRFVHVHFALLGGLVQLLLGWSYRILPSESGLPPPPFTAAKWSFYAFNAGVALAVWGHLAATAGGADPARSRLMWAGTALVAVGLLLSGVALRTAYPQKVAE